MEGREARKRANISYKFVQETQILPNGYSATISYAYDANGNRLSMTTPWGTFYYSYDSLNRVIAIRNPQNETVTFAYDADGRRKTMNYPNGIQTTYAYDAAGHLLQIVNRRTADNSAVTMNAYTYDKDGRRLSMQDLAGTHSYAYDSLHRLVSASHPAGSNLRTLNETFSYDKVGNRLADANITGYQYDVANRLTQSSSFTYTYDADGNELTTTNRATSAQASYTYDSKNALIAATTPGGTTASYKYDVLGRRVEKVVNGQTLHYVYDGQDIIAVLDANNNPVETFTHGPGVDEPLQMRKADGSEFFYHADAIGSVSALTAPDASIVETIEYEAYGRAVFSNGTATSTNSFVGSPYAFTARELDQETGLHYYRARTYDDWTGRFLQQDPLFNVNRYFYAAANPVNSMDPNGAANVPGSTQVGAVLSAITAYFSPGNLVANLLVALGPLAIAAVAGVELVGWPLVIISAGAYAWYEVFDYFLHGTPIDLSKIEIAGVLAGLPGVIANVTNAALQIGKEAAAMLGEFAVGSPQVVAAVISRPRSPPQYTGPKIPFSNDQLRVNTPLSSEHSIKVQSQATCTSSQPGWGNW